MIVTTKATWASMEDFCAGEPPDQWEGYEYSGPIGRLGKLFANLTRAGVQNPTPNLPTPWKLDYYDNLALAGQAMARDAAATAAPGRSTVNGTISPATVTSTQVGNAPEGGVGPMMAPDLAVTPGQDNTQVGFVPPPVSPQPKLMHTTFADAVNSNPAALTTKGKILDLILNAGIGAAAGDAAARTGDPRHGYAGLGAAALAGLQAPIQMQQQRVQAQAERTKLQQEQELRDAQIANTNAQANRRDVFNVPTVGLVQVGQDGTTKVLFPAEHIDKATPETLDQWIADSTNPDPKISGIAKAKLQAYQDMHPDKAPTGVDNDNRYLDIMTRQSQGQPVSPGDLAFAKSYATMKTLGPTAGATIRNEGMLQNREYPVLDTKNGNTPMFLNAADINAANKLEPGRYLPAGTAAPALTKTALIEDIRGNVQAVRQSLQNMPEFSPTMRTQVAVALKSRDPKSAVSSLMGSEAAKTMTPEQQDYLINTSLLIENAMAMRSVLGAGQGSEDLRSAITATIPGPTTPTKGYASKQLDAFEQVLNRLERGIPNVPLSNKGGKTPNQAGSGKAVSLAEARQLPAMRGKSDAEIIQAIQAAGHQVVQ